MSKGQVVQFKPRNKPPEVEKVSPEAQEISIRDIKRAAKYHHQKGKALERDKVELQGKLKQRDVIVEKLSHSTHLLEIKLYNRDKRKRSFLSGIMTILRSFVR